MLIYRSDGSAVAITAGEWLEYLDLARQHGWMPTGTSRPAVTLDVDREPQQDRDWSAAYAPACGQVVRREDARQLSIALERAEKNPKANRMCRSLSSLIHALSSGPVLLGDGDEPLRRETVASPTYEYANQTQSGD
ncbi:MAG: hypothetical protein K2X35_04365 [Bryobacteraceae bacterium]|nr:hypothetical protein [Bryobacteraceae bacterium]